MNAKQKAQELVEIFGIDTKKVIEVILARDQQWIDMLVEDEPDRWKKEDYNKCEKIWNEVLKYLP